MERDNQSTEYIIKELQEGRDEKENFRLLYHRYSGVIGGFFKKKGVTEWEELKDDVFFAVYNHVKELRDIAKFDYWLFTIARNTYRNWLKQEKAKRQFEVSMERVEYNPGRSDARAPGTMSPERDALEAEKLRKVWAALQELPPQKRVVAILAWVEGRSAKEISSILPIAINTVYVHLHQAQKILKERLSDMFEYVDVEGSR